MNDMHRMFLYFLERVDREDSDGMVTIGEIFFLDSDGEFRAAGF